MLPSKKTQNWLPSIFNDFLGNEWMAKSNSGAPSMNIVESDKAYKVEIAAPGAVKDNFSLKINDNNHLVITFKRSGESVEKDSSEKFLRREFFMSQFQQNLILPENVDKEKIAATLENGLFSVVIPKNEVVAQSDEKVIPIG